MFSGLVASVGTVAGLGPDPRGGLRLRVQAPQVLSEGVAPKDSVSISGVCLTVAACNLDSMSFDVVPETLERSVLGALVKGALVNVELSLRLGDRIGGHFVYGHVDATASIVAKEFEGQGYRLTLEMPATLAPYIVDKGYVAVDGVSLTIAAVRADAFDIALIPETCERTTLGRKSPGERVNIEIDPIARYAFAAAERYGRATDLREDELAWAYEI